MDIKQHNPTPTKDLFQNLKRPKLPSYSNQFSLSLLFSLQLPSSLSPTLSLSLSNKMSDGGLTVLDGTRLRAINLHLPQTTSDFITGAQLIEIAESQTSSSLFGFSLPDIRKFDALKRINLDAVTELDRDQASSKLKEYVIAVADGLKDDPLIVLVLDGNPLRLFLEDEDDFAMLAENLFTDLDTDDIGKISKSKTKDALVHMGVEMGVPTFSEFPCLNDILKKHGAEGDEELGQAQFAELLQLVLQDLADALAEKPIVVIQNVKIINGSKLRKFLADEKQLNNVIEKIFQDKDDTSKDGRGYKPRIRGYLEKNGQQFGLPPIEANESVILLFDQVFSDIGNSKSSSDLEQEEFGVLVKDILEKFAEELDVNPVLHDLNS